MKFMDVQTSDVTDNRYGIYEKFHHVMELKFSSDDIHHIVYWWDDAVQRGEDTKFYRVVDHKLVDSENDK